MAGWDGRMLFCAMAGIQGHTASPVATATKSADDPSARQCATPWSCNRGCQKEEPSRARSRLATAIPLHRWDQVITEKRFSPTFFIMRDDVARRRAPA